MSDEQKSFSFIDSIADMERAMREHAERMRIEMEHAAKERERLAFEAIPDHKPNRIQSIMMDHVAEVTGFAVIQDKGSAFQLVGSTLLTAKGCFSQARHNPKLPKDCIIMNIDSNDPYWYNVFFHEMAHATGVPRHLNRIGLAGLEKTIVDYCFEELIAETVASQLMERFGYANPETRHQNFAYIQNYEQSFEIYARLLALNPFERVPVRTIDRDLLAKNVADAKALVLQWVAEFDLSNPETIEKRVKIAHNFF